MQESTENFFQEAGTGSARDKLVQTAMRFFGERGLSAPMAEIAAAAGNRNKSAIAYHFEGRAGLIDAVYNEFRLFLEPRMNALLRELEAVPPEQLTLYEIVLALNAPFFALYGSEPDGSAAMKALARLGQDGPPGVTNLYTTLLAEAFNRYAHLILKTTPRKPMGQLKFHLAHYVMATVNGLAVTDRWKEVDFRSEPALMYELLLSYTDYVTGGIGASEVDRPLLDADRWRKAIRP